MFSAIYIEKEISEHVLTRKILNRFNDLPQISIDRYGEVFNRTAQNFRLQKRKPALILAGKHKNFVLPAPPGYGFGDGESYYFSHMLNCIYDCRYCFLQGMYRSAHYVLFVNFEAFSQEILTHINHSKSTHTYFYSGYDCDSLALEPLSGFTQHFLPIFKQNPNAWVELRTKSTQIRNLLDMEPIDNCVIAYSFTPETVAEEMEHKVPALQKRIDAIVRLQQRGWPVALRFEPLIYHQDFEASYNKLFTALFSRLNVNDLHSVSIGLFRVPNDFFSKMVKLYPDEKLFSLGMEKCGRLTSYKQELEEQMVAHCKKLLLKYVPESIFYRCVES